MVIESHPGDASNEAFSWIHSFVTSDVNGFDSVELSIRFVADFISVHFWLVTVDPNFNFRPFVESTNDDVVVLTQCKILFFDYDFLSFESEIEY